MTEPLLDDLRALLLAAGACQVGAADLTPLPEEVREGLPRGLSLGVLVDPSLVARLTEGPFIEYMEEYRRVNALLAELARLGAEWLTARGYRAVPQSPTEGPQDRATFTTPLPHKTVATRAGLGWIGKCALLVTEPFGSAVRLNSVLTDAPLPVGEPVTESRCGECVECLEICPGRAVVGELWQAGSPREVLLDAFACRREHGAQAQAAGMDYSLCGRCLTVCPWTQAHLRRILT